MSSVWRSGGRVYRNGNGKVVRCASCPIDCGDPGFNPVPPDFPDWPYSPPDAPVPGDFPADELLYQYVVAWTWFQYIYASDDCSGSLKNGSTEWRLNPNVTVTAITAATPTWTGTGTLERRFWNSVSGSWDAWATITSSCGVTLAWRDLTVDVWRLSVSNVGSGGYWANKDVGKTPVGTKWIGRTPTFETEGCFDVAIGGSQNLYTVASVA